MKMAVDRKAITKAKSRLRVAEEALMALKGCTTIEAFSDTWYKFLVSTKNIYTLLEQGSKTTPQNRQWFGAKKNERKSDPLLQYLFHARNSEEHGLEPIARKISGHLSIGARLPGSSNSFSINGSLSADGSLHLRPKDGKPIAVTFSPEHIALSTVEDIGGNKYEPPTKHLGKDLADTSPYAVGELALKYLQNLVGQAEQLT